MPPSWESCEPEMLEILSDYTLRTVALGAGVLGVTSGILGSFAVLRRQSLLGDAISHAALPGIVLAYLLLQSRTTMVLMLGALAAGWIATLAVIGIVRTTRIKYDASLGIILSVFFGLGLVLLTFLQKRPDAGQAGLETFLFGQAAALIEDDVRAMALLGGIAIAVTALLWKEFKLLSFDPDFGASLGFPMRRVDMLLTGLLALAIVVGLQTVGVVLMSAMVVAPGAAARQWTDRLGVMVVLAAVFGAGSGIAGAVLSSTTPRLPTGPTIVLCVSAVVVVSLLFAPRRGLMAGWARARGQRARLAAGSILDDLYRLDRQHAGTEHAHPAAVLSAMDPRRTKAVGTSLRRLEERGLARRVGEDDWMLTSEGRSEAERRAEDEG
jgi:manganese/zinc/iron transport system permease protein